MRVLRRLARAPAASARTLARALTAAFDRLTGLVGRSSDRVEAHLSERTTLLRAHYARTSIRQAAPSPLLDAPVDLTMRGGIQ